MFLAAGISHKLFPDFDDVFLLKCIGNQLCLGLARHKILLQKERTLLCFGSCCPLIPSTPSSSLSESPALGASFPSVTMPSSFID